MKSFGKWAILGVIVLVVSVWWSRSLQNKDPNLVSSRGIHWHPDLSIMIDGKIQEIPAGIGLQAGHMPIHTHDEGTDAREAGRSDEGHKPLHLEFGSAVMMDDIRLGSFFQIWGKTFNSQCIFDSCIDEGGSLKMLVNGKENNEFENYVMEDGDRIEIVYKSISN